MNQIVNDPLYQDVLNNVLSTGNASVNRIQRQLLIDYSRAYSMVEAMTDAGIVSPMDSKGHRIVFGVRNEL